MIDKILFFPYFLVLLIRNFLYNKGICKSVKAEVPTICIGNIAVGGTGKTPHTEAVLKMLAESDEWGASNIALLSRGYKRKSSGFRFVPFNGNASTYGDEPLMLKKHQPVVTVAVDRDRINGCRLLCHPDKAPGGDKYQPAELIVLDDAFQYRKLRSDLNIVLTDYTRPHYKDMLLPLGRLRDLPERLFDADVIVITKCPMLLDDEKADFVRRLGLKDYDLQTCEALSAKGRKILVVFTGISYSSFKSVYDCADQRYIYSHKVILFTGIAKDTPLCNYLSDTYKLVSHIKFPDHHNYERADIERILAAVKRNPTAAVVTTEKDAQRLVDYNGLPKIIKERIFCVPIVVGFLSENEELSFRNRIVSLPK